MTNPFTYSAIPNVTDRIAEHPSLGRELRYNGRGEPYLQLTRC